MLEHVLWEAKYRPKKIADCILPDNQKTLFSNIVSDGKIPNLLLSGPPGVGKTTVAMAMLTEMDVDFIKINGSMYGNIDTLRNEILHFASSVSIIEGGRKAIILDEADYLNANSTQPALRGFMDEFSGNAAFILTCNFRNRIIEPLQKRCSLIEFLLPKAKEEKDRLFIEALKRLLYILDSEKVEYDKKVVAALLKRYFPDMRRTINELQTFAKIGKIDVGALAEQHTETKELMEALRDKNFKKMREWVAENSDLDFTLFASELYKKLPDYMEPSNLPYLVLHLNKYDYQNSFVSNKEVNLVAMLTEIMKDCWQ